MAEVKIKKKNRVLFVEEGRLDGFLKQGYDQINDKGEVVKRATGGRMVSLPEYNKLIDRVEELEKELALKSKTTTKKAE